MNIQVNQNLHTKNCNRGTVINYKNYSSNRKLRIKITLLNEKKYRPVGSIKEIISINRYDKIKIVKKLLKLNVLFLMPKQKDRFHISVGKKKCSSIRSKLGYKNKSNVRSRSTSPSQYNLYNFKYRSYVLKRKLTSWQKRNSHKKMIVNRYSKSSSTNDACKISCTHKSRKSSEIKSSILASLKLNRKSTKSNSHLRGSTFIYPSRQKHQERYTDILREVKKILNEDIISKRKLKYIFKKRKIFLPISNLKLRSSSIDNTTIFEKKQHDKFYRKKVEPNKLKYCKSHLSIKETLDRIGANSRSNKDTIDVSDKNLLYEKLKPSTIFSQIKAQPNLISRTPSPALPLIRDEAVLKETIDSTKELPFIKEMNLSENLPNFSFKLCNSMQFADYSKHLSIKKQFLSISEHSSKSSNTIDNTLVHLCKEAKDILYTNDIKLNEQCSVYQLSSSPHSEANCQSLTPLKISPSKHWSPIFLMQKNRSNLSLNVDNSVLKSKEETLIYTTQSTPPKTSFLELSRSESPNFDKCFKQISNNCKRRSRSMSIPRYSRSTSRSASSASFVNKRSCSKESTRTLLSSLRRSRSSYYCSSRSSSVSCRTSRQTSFDSSRSRSPSIPRRHGSPSFLDRRRITSARKRPVPYHRSTPSPLTSSSSVESNSCNDWSSRNHRLSQTPSCSSLHLIT